MSSPESFSVSSSDSDFLEDGDNVVGFIQGVTAVNQPLKFLLRTSPVPISGDGVITLLVECNAVNL